jgi:hypothetical protein
MCYNCKNGIKKKRERLTKSAKRTVTVVCLTSKNIYDKTKSWDLKETIILVEVVTLHPELREK